MLIDITQISHEEEQLALMSAGLRCCDVGGCDKPAEAVEEDTDGTRLYRCAPTIATEPNNRPEGIMSTYEIGKTYEINHSRKGKMTVLVNHVNEGSTWVQATIVAGKAVGVRGDVQAAKGDDLRFRASLATILREVPQT